MSSYDPSPDGVSLGSGHFTEFDPCETCYCKGKCPRCGGLMALGQDLLEEETPCAWCGFIEGAEGMPPVYECSCWYDVPVTYWVYDSIGRRARDGAQNMVEFTFSIPESDPRHDSLLAQAFIAACRNAGLLPSACNFVIASR